MSVPLHSKVGPGCSVPAVQSFQPTPAKNLEEIAASATSLRADGSDPFNPKGRYCFSILPIFLDPGNLFLRFLRNLAASKR
jgi:hypothetical protein